MIATSTITLPKRRGRPPKQPIAPIPEPETTPFDAADTPEIDAESTIGADSRESIPPYPVLPKYSSVGNILATWNGLSDRQREFGNIYLYREWPKMLLVMQKGRLVNENCGKFTVLDEPVTLEAIKLKHRMGRYYIRLVQRVVKPYGQMCQSEPFNIDGNLENIEDMPILDIDKLDRTHPDNESYLRILKLRGIIKVDAATQGEGDEMAASEVLGNLTNKALDMLGNQNQPHAHPGATDVSAGVGTELVGLLREQINVNRPPAQQGTVKDQLEGLVTLAKTMTPAPAPALDMGPYLALHSKNNELVERIMNMQVQQAQMEATKAREEAAQYRAAIPQPKTVDEQWDDLERAAKRFERMTGRGKQKEDEDDGEKENLSTAAGFWGGLFGSLPQILKGGVELLREVNVGLYNYKLNGSGVPPLNPATGEPGTEPLAPGNGEEQPQLSPEEEAKMAHIQNVVNQLSVLAQPMLNHFLRFKSGNEFAKFVIDNYGPQAFELVRGVEGGKDTLLAMIQQYPPVWNQIGPQRLVQFQKFLDEFMSYTGVPVQ